MLHLKRKKNKDKVNRSRGFTMIELIITIAILSFGIIGIYSAFSPIIELTYTISIKFNAAYLAQEGLEIVRNIRDNNFINNATWSAGLLSCASGCQADYKTLTAVETAVNQLQAYNPNNFLRLNADGFYSYDSGINTIVKRKITITQPSFADNLKVDVSVMWDYNGKSFSFQTEEYIYNWY